MNKIYLSKSKYCKLVQCPKILWMSKYKPDVAVPTAREAVLANGTAVGELARNLPKPNVFDIVGGMHRSKKFEKYYEGKISFRDLQNEDLNPKFLEQINFELNNLKPKIEKEAIKGIMDSLKYPLYFIDYETYQLAIPEVEGTKPYQQLPFQYSLHIIKEKGAPIEHKEFLAEIDDPDHIRHFAESMIKDMPENGSVIIYNKAFEPTRNNEIARMYPI